MADQQDATSTADVDTSATGDDDAEQLLADAVNNDGETDEDAKADEDDKPLGPAGEKALQAEKEKARALRATVRQLKSEQAARDAERDAELAALRKQVEKLTPKPAPAKKDTDPEPDPDPVDVEELRRQAREQVEAELKAAQAHERVLDKIELKATKGFIDPADAVARLMRESKTEDFLDDAGNPDVEAIQDALEDLLKRAPHLAATAQGGGKRFTGSGDGGAKPNKPARPQSLGEAIHRELNKSST